MLAVLGSLTLFVFIQGGFTWLVSAGNAEKVQAGTKTMLYAIIGLFIIFASYAIINTLLGGLGGGENKKGQCVVAGEKTMDDWCEESKSEEGTCAEVGSYCYKAPNGKCTGRMSLTQACATLKEESCNLEGYCKWSK